MTVVLNWYVLANWEDCSTPRDWLVRCCEGEVGSSERSVLYSDGNVTSNHLGISPALNPTLFPSSDKLHSTKAHAPGSFSPREIPFLRDLHNHNMESSDARDAPMQQGTDAETPACQTCRSRKLRCTRELPACSRCARLGEILPHSDDRS
jgi:hypothetical protein